MINIQAFVDLVDVGDPALDTLCVAATAAIQRVQITGELSCGMAWLCAERGGTHSTGQPARFGGNARAIDRAIRQWAREHLRPGLMLVTLQPMHSSDGAAHVLVRAESFESEPRGWSAPIAGRELGAWQQLDCRWDRYAPAPRS